MPDQEPDYKTYNLNDPEGVIAIKKVINKAIEKNFVFIKQVEATGFPDQKTSQGLGLLTDELEVAIESRDSEKILKVQKFINTLMEKGLLIIPKEFSTIKGFLQPLKKQSVSWKLDENGKNTDATKVCIDLVLNGFKLSQLNAMAKKKKSDQRIRDSQLIYNAAVSTSFLTLKRLKEDDELTSETLIGLKMVMEYLDEKLIEYKKKTGKTNIFGKTEWVDSQTGIMITSFRYTEQSLAETAKKNRIKIVVYPDTEDHADEQSSGLNRSIRVGFKATDERFALHFMSGKPEFVILDSNGLPILSPDNRRNGAAWGRILKNPDGKIIGRDYNFFEQPYRKIVRNTKGEVVGFITATHAAVDLNVPKNSYMGSPFAAYVAKVSEKAKSGELGGTILIRGFIKAEEGKYEEVKLIVHHLAGTPLRKGSFVNAGELLGYGGWVPDNSAYYFCIATEVSGKRIRITDLVKQGVQFMSLKDLKKLSEQQPELVKEGKLSVDSGKFKIPN